MQQVMFLMRIAGPAIAGLLVANFGPSSCYLADAASFAASASLIASVALKRPEPTHPTPTASARSSSQKSSKASPASGPT